MNKLKHWLTLADRTGAVGVLGTIVQAQRSADAC